MVFTSRAIATRNGAGDQLVYRVGITVLDTKDPRKLILRTDALMFVPEENWEKVAKCQMWCLPRAWFGKVRDTSFTTRADKYVGVVEASLPQ